MDISLTNTVYDQSPAVKMSVKRFKSSNTIFSLLTFGYKQPSEMLKLYM